VAALEPRLQLYVESTLADPAPWEMPLPEYRASLEKGIEQLWDAPPTPVAEVYDVAIDGPQAKVAMRIYRPHDGELPGFVYMHGGGWVLGSIATVDHLCRSVASQTPAVVISIEYRLAPEHPFPAAVEDCWAGLRWAARSAAQLGIDPNRLAVGGDSAGGNLAAVMALRARDGGLPLALQVLIYPVTDADFESESYREHASGLNLTRTTMRWFWDLYLAGASASDPDAAPLRARVLGGVAPALVQTAEYDPLRSDGEAYARQLARAGVAVTHTAYEGVIHGFVQMPAYTDAAAAAIDEIAACLRAARATGASDSPRSKQADATELRVPAEGK
jgi:acetyl esterase